MGMAPLNEKLHMTSASYLDCHGPGEADGYLSQCITH